MTDQTRAKDGKAVGVSGLELLRAPFPPNQISKLPKPTKRQTEEVRNDFKKGIRCPLCGAWHHPQVVHLDYVGHAALTDRLLDCDPGWNWAPVALADDGTPKLDQFGGMWIKLTVCGQTRLGYGHADGKSGGDAIKEVIGDALRNAAMRFGAALDLWHKGELHLAEAQDAADAEGGKPEHPVKTQAKERDPDAMRDSLIAAVGKAENADHLNHILGGQKFDAAWQWLAEHHEDYSLAVRRAVDEARERYSPDETPPAPNADLGNDEIPY